jgi:hypothetical protein
MTWTVEDERQYQELLRQKRALEAQASGDRALDDADKRVGPRRSPSDTEQKSGFSLTRMIGGAAQDVWNNAVELMNYADQKSDEMWQQATGIDFRSWTISKALSPDLTVDAISESKNPWEKAGRSLVGFMVPYAGAGKAFGAFKAGIGFTSAASRSLAAATAVNLTVMDGTENNLANLLRDDFGFDNELLDTLATEEDDDLLVGRVKSAISNLPVDLAGEAVVEGAIRLARMYKGVRTNNQATKDLIETTKQDLTVNRAAAKAAAESNPDNAIKLTATEEAPAKTPLEQEVAAVVAQPGATLRAVGPDETVAKASQVKERPITSLDEFVTELRKQTDTVTDPALLVRLSNALLNDPHEALSVLKIDPAKLDYSVFSDPAAIKAMQESLGSLVDDIAAKVGRTNEVVSNKETLKAARLMAAQPWQIKKLLEGVKGLPTRLTAARIMVGSHAHKLLEAAEQAAKEIKAGGAGKAYADFTATLETHGHLLGVLRGAGSEIGRALQSLQMSVDVATQYKSLAGTAAEAAQRAEALKAQRLANLAKGREAKAAADAMTKVDVGSDDVIGFLKEVAEGRIDMARLDDIAKAAGVTPERAAKEMGLKMGDLTKAKKAQEAYEGMFSDLQTDAGRLRMIEQLRDVKGDLTKLSRITKRRQQTGWVRKVDAGLKDTTGALFSPFTAIANLSGAAIMNTFKGFTHGLSALGLKGTSLITGSQEAGIAARKQALKSWATFHAPVAAFRDGFSNAWQSFKASGLEELSIIADGLKLEKVAKDMQAASNRAARQTEQSFLKQDFQSERGFGVSPETLNALQRDIEQFPVGRLGQLGMEWFLRTGAAAVNVTGGLFRLGTSTFINAPDQVAGTFATRVGQHTAAIDIAAKEAAEAGLDGDALMQYIKGRAMELGELIDDGVIGSDPFMDGQRDLMEKAGIDYARELNFSDDIETEWVRKGSQFVGDIPIAGTLVMPFPKTPLRVMERTILDYTPLYALKKATREAWASGNAEVRGEIAARMTLATAMMAAAWELTADRTIVGFDGGYRSTARRERPSYSIRVFGDVYEFNRIDPIGTVMGLMADIRQIGEEGKDNRELVQMVEGDGAYARTLAADATEAVFWGLFKNILSKAYLDGLEQLNAMSAARGPEEFSSLAESYAASLGTRAIPLSGVQRQLEKLEDPTMRTARGVMEGMVKASFGSDTLPARRDPIFGRPMQFSEGERLVGFKGGPIKDDPINRELARLAFDVGQPKWKQRDVELTGAQMSRYLELRGHTVQVDGVTLEDAVEGFLSSPGYDGLTDDARVAGIKEIMRPYSKAALDQLIAEDDDFAFKALVMEVRDDFRLQGRDMRELMPEAERLAKELGINRKQ